MPKIVENHTHKSGNYHEKGTLRNGTTPYHGQVKLPPRDEKAKFQILFKLDVKGKMHILYETS